MAKEIYTDRWCEFCSRSGIFIDSPAEGDVYFYCPLCEKGCLSDEMEENGCLFDEGHDSLEEDEIDEKYIPDFLIGEDFFH